MHYLTKYQNASCILARFSQIVCFRLFTHTRRLTPPSLSLFLPRDATFLMQLGPIHSLSLSLSFHPARVNRIAERLVHNVYIHLQGIWTAPPFPCTRVPIKDAAPASITVDLDKDEVRMYSVLQIILSPRKVSFLKSADLTIVKFL